MKVHLRVLFFISLTDIFKLFLRVKLFKLNISVALYSKSLITK